ncbi:MAG TPA: hypothetical protein VEJ47_12485 [Candidatus Eremiobacteraceae bacterium]|nr:hypothetical protein [Candidatus Eremiobacteraceae bacterium]
MTESLVDDALCYYLPSAATPLRADRSFPDNHRLTADPNFIENSDAAQERYVDTT